MVQGSTFVAWGGNILVHGDFPRAVRIRRSAPRNPSGSLASMCWNGLQAGLRCRWGESSVRVRSPPSTRSGGGMADTSRSGRDALLGCAGSSPALGTTMDSAGPVAEESAFASRSHAHGNNAPGFIHHVPANIVAADTCRNNVISGVTARIVDAIERHPYGCLPAI